MLLSWLWISSSHLPAGQQDCQTPKSENEKDKTKITTSIRKSQEKLCRMQMNQSILSSSKYWKCFHVGSKYLENNFLRLSTTVSITIIYCTPTTVHNYTGSLSQWDHMLAWAFTKVKHPQSYPACAETQAHRTSGPREVRLCSHVAFTFTHTWPLSMTMTLLQLITVLRRWAMMRVVQLPNAQRMVSWMRRSVSVSMAAVASSSMRIY